jgi:hypothetical protein
MRLILLAALLVSITTPAETTYGKDPKMKAEELVEKHLASIGKADALAAARTRAMSGTAQVTFRLPTSGLLAGKGNLLSDGKKVRVTMEFGALEYPVEQAAFDGEHITVGQIRPGQRSALGGFLYVHDVLLKDGLLCGSMTTAWALLDVAGRQAKLEYTGLKKIDGRQLHEMKYRSKKGAGDLQVALYFDPESFRHVATISKLVQPASMGRSPMESSGQRDILYQLKEDYSDFKEVDSLTLPHAYKLVYTMEGQNQTILVDYNLAMERVAHNQPIDPKYFAVQ